MPNGTGLGPFFHVQFYFDFVARIERKAMAS